MDVTRVPSRRLGHLTAVIDCHDRDVTSFEFALRDLLESALSRCRPPLPPSPGVHHAPPRPEQNGIVERFFRSLK